MAPSNYGNTPGFGLGRAFAVGVVAIVGIFLLMGLGSIVENVDATEITVIQSPVSGNIKVPIVPNTVFGGDGKGNSAATLLDLLTIQAAKQVGLGKE